MGIIKSAGENSHRNRLNINFWTQQVYYCLSIIAIASFLRSYGNKSPSKEEKNQQKSLKEVLPPSRIRNFLKETLSKKSRYN